MPFSLKYHPSVRDEDLLLIDRCMKDRIRKAIEERLQTAPQDYGNPLRKDLKGYRKLRVGDYRVVYKISGTEVWILGVRHWKSVYHYPYLVTTTFSSINVESLAVQL